MSLSTSQDSIQSSAQRFAVDVLNPLFSESSNFPKEAWLALGEFGLFGASVGEEHGGLGLSCSETSSLLEVLGYSMTDHGLLHAACTQMLCARMLDRFGSEGQKQRYLRGICSGNIIASQAMTEPGAGSDLPSITTSAVPDGDDYLLTGSKTFISNAPIAHLIFVFCVTDAQRQSFGRLSCFAVEVGVHKGVAQGAAIEKMGLSSLQFGEIFFDGCRLGAQDLLGKRGGGDVVFNDVITLERTLLFATMAGKQRAIIEKCVTYANDRIQGGNPIGKNQAVSHAIANMKVHQHLSWLAVKDAASAKDEGRPAMLESSIAKLFVSESLKSACLSAVQIHGAYGYSKEYGVERDLRDAVASTIYSGTSEIQRNIIARFLGL